MKRFLPSVFYVAEFPAKPDTFDLSKIDAAALIHYSGSRYADGPGITYAAQTRELQFSILLYLSGEYGGTGAYTHLDTLRKVLQNADIEGAGPLKLSAEQLLDQSAGRWEWQITVTCAALSVAAEQNPPHPRIPLNRFQEE
nr:Gp37 family protein [Labrenzia sp. R4_2]